MYCKIFWEIIFFKKLNLLWKKKDFISLHVCLYPKIFREYYIFEKLDLIDNSNQTKKGESIAMQDKYYYYLYRYIKRARLQGNFFFIENLLDLSVQFLLALLIFWVRGMYHCSSQIWTLFRMALTWNSNLKQTTW